MKKNINKQIKKKKTLKKKKQGGNKEKKNKFILSNYKKFIKYNKKHISILLNNTKEILENNLVKKKDVSFDIIVSKIKKNVIDYVYNSNININKYNKNKKNHKQTNRKTHKQKKKLKNLVQGGDGYQNYRYQISSIFIYICISYSMLFIRDFIKENIKNDIIIQHIGNSSDSEYNYIKQYSRDSHLQFINSQIEYCTQNNNLSDISEHYCSNIMNNRIDNYYIESLSNYNNDVEGRYYRSLLMSNGGIIGYFINFMRGKIQDNINNRNLFYSVINRNIIEATYVIQFILAILILFRSVYVSSKIIEDISRITLNMIKYLMGIPIVREPNIENLLFNTENINIHDIRFELYDEDEDEDEDEDFYSYEEDITYIPLLEEDLSYETQDIDIDYILELVKIENIDISPDEIIQLKELSNIEIPNAYQIPHSRATRTRIPHVNNEN